MSAVFQSMDAEMRRIGRLADHVDTMRAIGPYVLDGGRWRRRSDEERVGRLFSLQAFKRVTWSQDPFLSLLKKRNPTAREGRDETTMTDTTSGANR